METPLGIEAVSAWLGVPVATLRDWRSKNKGPVSYRIGQRVVYDRTAVDAWLAAQRQATAAGAA